MLGPLLTAGGDPLEVSTTPAFGFSESTSAASGTTSGTATLSVVGEIGSFTAVWESDDPSVTVTSPTSTTTTTFGYTGLEELFAAAFAAVTVTVTDSGGRTGSYTFIVNIWRSA